MQGANLVIVLIPIIGTGFLNKAMSLSLFNATQIFHTEKRIVHSEKRFN